MSRLLLSRSVRATALALHCYSVEAIKRVRDGEASSLRAGLAIARERRRLPGNLRSAEKSARLLHRMIIYSVTVTIEAAMEGEWLDWMRRIHVPDVRRTGCFTEEAIYKLVEPTGDEATYVIQYRCSSMEEYQRYRDHFAHALQKEHGDRFRGRFRASRQILEER